MKGNIIDLQLKKITKADGTVIPKIAIKVKYVGEDGQSHEASNLFNQDYIVKYVKEQNGITSDQLIGREVGIFLKEETFVDKKTNQQKTVKRLDNFFLLDVNGKFIKFKQNLGF